MNEVMDALVNRRSVRKYKAEAVPEELVKEKSWKLGCMRQAAWDTRSR